MISAGLQFWSPCPPQGAQSLVKSNWVRGIPPFVLAKLLRFRSDTFLLRRALNPLGDGETFGRDVTIRLAKLMNRILLFAALVSWWTGEVPSCRKVHPGPLGDFQERGGNAQADRTRANQPKPPTLENIDSDGDGLVSRTEFLAFHNKRMEAVFFSLDRNRSGNLDKTEVGGSAKTASAGRNQAFPLATNRRPAPGSAMPKGPTPTGITNIGAQRSRPSPVKSLPLAPEGTRNLDAR